MEEITQFQVNMDYYSIEKLIALNLRKLYSNLLTESFQILRRLRKTVLFYIYEAIFMLHTHRALINNFLLVHKLIHKK